MRSSSPPTARLVIDGKEVEESLMDLVIRTLEANPNNSLIAFRYMTCAHSTVRFYMTCCNLMLTRGAQ
jgi:hypothetical protein